MKQIAVLLCAFAIFATLNFCSAAQASSLESMNFHPLRVTTADNSTIVTLSYVDVRETVSYGLDDARVELVPGRWFLFNQAGFFYLNPLGTPFHSRNESKRMKNVAKALVKEGLGGGNVSCYYVGGSKGLFTGSDVTEAHRFCNLPGGSSQSNFLTLVSADLIPHLIQRNERAVNEHSPEVLPTWSHVSLKVALQFVIGTGADYQVTRKRKAGCSSTCACSATGHEIGHRDASRIERLLRGAGLLEKDKAEVGKPDAFHCKAELAAAFKEYLADDEVFKSAAVHMAGQTYESTAEGEFQDELLTACYRRITERLAVPLEVAQLRRDESAISDGTWLAFNNGRSMAPSDCMQNPRAEELKQYRTELNAVVDQLLGTLTVKDVSGERVVFNVKRVMKLQLFNYLAESNDFSKLPALLRFKLSFDGTLCGLRSLLAFLLIPLSLVHSSQSNLHTMPIAIGWGTETAAALLNYIPQLTETIAELERDGITYDHADGTSTTFQVRVDIAADMSSLWKAGGIGGASSEENCIFCHCTAAERNDVGHEHGNLENVANQRRNAAGNGPLTMFGLPVMTRVHICTLHCITRVTEKLVKCLVAAAYARTSFYTTERRAAIAALDTAKAELARHRRGTPPHVAAATVVATKTAQLAAATARVAGCADGETISAAMLAANIGRKSFFIEVEKRGGVRGNAETFKVETSTLTGDQALKLCGNVRTYPTSVDELAALEALPILGVIDVAVGSCGHPISQALGVAGPPISDCFTCNVRNVWLTWSAYIIPMLRAKSRADVHAASPPPVAAAAPGAGMPGAGVAPPPAGALPGGAAAAAPAPAPPAGRWNYEGFRTVARNFGLLLNHTFSASDAQNVITTYRKLM